MAVELEKFVLLICLAGSLGHNVRQELDPGKPVIPLQDPDPSIPQLKRQDLDTDHQHPQWHDLVAFVNRKIENMERLLTEKDERIDKLELNIASQMTEIKQLKQGMTSLEEEVSEKDEAVNTLVTRVSHLERVVMFDSITGESESGQKARSQFPRTYNETERGLGNKVEKIATQQLPTPETSNYQNDSIVPSHSEQHIKNDDNLLQKQSAEENTVAYTKNRSEDSPKAKYSRFRQKRVDSSSLPAFHVAMSGNKAVTPDTTVIYNHETLDHGDGYNTVTGFYTVPESGTYVLTWTTICYPHNQFQTVLEVNGVVRGSSWSDSQNINDYQQTTAIVVLTLNQGDRVFIRMGHSYGHGTIVTRSYVGESTFSGWKLD